MEEVRFFKSVNRDHPMHILPTVEWQGGKAVFEFARGPSGMLEFTTGDPKLIAKLRQMGYGEEAPPRPEYKGAGATVATTPLTPLGEDALTTLPSGGTGGPAPAAPKKAAPK